MKSNRITLENPSEFNYTNKIMQKLREKYRDCRALDIKLIDEGGVHHENNITTIREEGPFHTTEKRSLSHLSKFKEGENDMVFSERSRKKDSYFQTPLRATENFSFSKSALVTKEETELKKYDTVNSGQGFFTRPIKLLDLKFFAEDPKETTNPSNRSENEKKLCQQFSPGVKKGQPTLENYSVGKISTLLMPRPGEYASQISLGEEYYYSASSESLPSPYSAENSEDYDDFSSINSIKIKEVMYNGDVSNFSLKTELALSSPKILEKKIYNLNLRSPTDFKKFGLKLNSQTQTYHSPSNVCHPFLPLRYKDDEEYKKKLYKYLKYPKFTSNKTDTLKSNLKRKFSEAFDGNLTKLSNLQGTKVRKITSEKKIFESCKPFFDNRVDASGQSLEEKKPLSPQYFKIYADNDIGFTSKWQQQLKSAEMDDDVETDEDQLRAADRHTSRELGEGIRLFVKNKSNVRNYNLLKLN